jgi:hypothetical protein
METIFIDIGAHIGESIEIACNKKYNFTRIIAIEPSTLRIVLQCQICLFQEP